ncbi:MAG: NADH-quinone oxidoreductase subunit H, partial [Holosporales bacterium]|nr:NADH-quinone oxidoreductase subunit H [Holosporales bacterium]
MHPVRHAPLLSLVREVAYVFEILILYLVCITAAAYVSLLERKLIARIQLRIGPSL